MLDTRAKMRAAQCQTRMQQKARDLAAAWVSMALD